jgi:hypothetical protein
LHQFGVSFDSYYGVFIYRVKLVRQYVDVDTTIHRNSRKLHAQDKNVMAQETCIFKALNICMSKVLCL